MNLTTNLKSNLINLKSNAGLLVSESTSLYSNVTLTICEIENLIYITAFVDSIILGKINSSRSPEEHIVYARLLEVGLILSASKNKYVKKIVKQIENIIG